MFTVLCSGQTRLPLFGFWLGRNSRGDQVFVPHFSADSTAFFRDAMPFLWDMISSAGHGPVNARLLWEAGISYDCGTDTNWQPKQSLADDLR